jgi:VWFA-related protein
VPVCCAALLALWGLGGAAMAQESPFASSNPFEMASGERPIKLFGPGQEPGPLHPRDGDIVLWSAVADDDGRPVDGLNRGDFSLEVDGDKREIAWFARRPAGSGGEQAGPAAPGWYVAVFDLTVGDTAMMREAGEKLMEAVASRLDEDEQVAVVFFDGRIDVVTPFTRSADEIRIALAKIPDEPVYNIHDFFGLRVKVTARGETKITSTLDKSDDTAQHNFAAYRFFTEMRRLALELADVPGRKQVMFFSGGFNRRWMTRTKEDVAYLRMVDALCRGTSAVYTYNAVDEDYLERILASETIKRKRKEMAGTTELKYAGKFLAELAESTGGVAWAADEKDEPAAVVEALFRDGRHHYLLGFPRGGGTRTGSFLPCEVKAKGAPDVRAPLGFYDN